MERTIAQVATASAIFSIDKVYDYEVASEQVQQIKRGSRVIVPFGRGDKAAFGFVLNITGQESGRKLKKISHVYEDFAIGEEEIALAHWMCARYFCTFFEAATLLVPPGIWGKAQEDGAKGVVQDKKIKYVRLNMPYDTAAERIGNSKAAAKRRIALDCFLDYEELPEKELVYLTGVSQAVVKGLCEKGILVATYREIYRRPVFQNASPKRTFTLSGQQQQVFEAMVQQSTQGAGVALLHGITGSGKTEVYMKLIEHMLSMGKTAMMLIPEIALTPQMVQRFYSFFKDKLAVMHSALTKAQRYDEYKRVQKGEASIVIGTRSAVFAPLKNIGIIIVDEEQEYSYKSDNSPKYSAIDLAKVRVATNDALLVLGSATPSVESYYYATQGKYSLYELESRFGETPLPDVCIADMRQKHKNEGVELSDQLAVELASNLQQKEQTILFVNRRGSNRIACVDCGFVPECEHCSVALTYHGRNNRLMCHYCGFSQDNYTACPKCGSRNIKEIGIGTQRGETALKERFPDARVFRMDADTTVERVSHEKILEEFDKNGDILIGTQMVAKGLDFDRVSLVGVLDSDISLYSGDFRAAARTFSLISQVVGRGGRRQKQGRAVIQTFSPQHPVILSAAQQDYKQFYQYEIQNRMALNLPPFSDIFLFSVVGEDEVQTMKGALRLSATLHKAFEGQFQAIHTEILGPVAPNLYKINDKYRYNLSFRGKDNKITRELVNQLIVAFYKENKSKLMLTAEINPLNY